jgi:hypothetical protein
MKPTPRLDSWRDVEGFVATQEFKDAFNEEGAKAFLESNPTFPQLDITATILYEWLNSRDLPFSRANCEYAWKLLDLGHLTPVEIKHEPKAKQVVIEPIRAPQVAEPTEEEAEALEKLRDVPHLSDQQRKIRDAKLRTAAIASRNTHRKHGRPALVG